MKACPFTILVDTAEQQPYTFQGLRADADQDYEEFIVSTIPKCLGRYPNSLGDYSIVGGEKRCHVERKSKEDFHSTVLGFTEGNHDRFRSELENLSKLEAPLLVIECVLDELLADAPEHGKKPKQQNAKILDRSVLAFMMDYRVPIYWASSRQAAMHYTFRWFYRFWEKNLKPSRKHKGESTLLLPGLEPEADPQTIATPSILDLV